MGTFSITEINTDKLNTKISEYMLKENRRPYVFANKETFDILTNLSGQYSDFITSQLGEIRVYPYGNCLVSNYQNNKMFIDDTLGFGEIELR